MFNELYKRNYTWKAHLSEHQPHYSPKAVCHYEIVAVLDICHEMIAINIVEDKIITNYKNEM